MPADSARAWDSLGYPRRALRLKECAAVIASEHGDRVPCGEQTLRALPGIGAYTAAAVAAFACGQRTTVLDVNIRRVLARAFDGHAHPKGALTKSETAWAAQFVPAGPDAPGARHVAWNAGVMELGALVCTSRSSATGSGSTGSSMRSSPTGWPPSPAAGCTCRTERPAVGRPAPGRPPAAQRCFIMRVLPSVLGLTRARSRNSATFSSWECSSST